MKTSGLTDPDLLNLLLELGIDSETLAALTLVPLVEMAWADGSISAHERVAVLEAATLIGVVRESENYLLTQELARGTSHTQASRGLGGLCRSFFGNPDSRPHRKLLGLT